MADNERDADRSPCGSKYGFDRWGLGYLRPQADGHLAVVPRPGHPDSTIDLFQLTDDLRRRGIPLPMLLRFDGILEDRVEHLFGSFAAAIEQRDYRGRYRGVYPIKVNQQRHVVETLLDVGRQYGLGLEVGSKPELLAALAMCDRDDAFIICNGYKDRLYLETALLASRLGRQPILVIERLVELRQLIELSQQTGIRATIGLRARLSTRGKGFWEDSGGERSKFGLGSAELLEALELLRQADQLSDLQLLHFHVGSQITAIANVRKVLREGTRVFAELVRLGAPLQLLDVGGGLGVDYDGSHTHEDVSRDYTDAEYASAVVSVVGEVCDTADVSHPDLISESGRALVAHHSMLIVDVLGERQRAALTEPAAPPADAAATVQRLWDRLQQLNAENAQDALHEALLLKEEATGQFQHGALSLDDRARAEALSAVLLSRIRDLVDPRRLSEDDARALELGPMTDTVFCNFSVFQSLPDAWAMGHRFPVTPLQQLHRPADRRAVLADLTCDSDGCVSRFIPFGDDPEPPAAIALPTRVDGEPYYLAFFLVGAYQEILGDPHNLFGDTSAVHVHVDTDGHYEVRHVVPGDRVGEVLDQLDYQPQELVERVRQAAERAVRRGALTLEESGRLLRRYEEGLAGYTYLDTPFE